MNRHQTSNMECKYLTLPPLFYFKPLQTVAKRQHHNSPQHATSVTRVFKIVLSISCLSISIAQETAAQDRVYRWHSQHNYTFSDTPPFPLKAFDFHEVYSKNSHSNNTRFTSSSKAQGKRQQKKLESKLKPSDASKLPAQTLSNNRYCENIKTTLHKLQAEKRFAWDPNTQELIKNKSKNRLRKSLQKEWLEQCRNTINLNFIEII